MWFGLWFGLAGFDAGGCSGGGVLGLVCVCVRVSDLADLKGSG